MDTKAILVERVINFSVPKYRVRVWIREALDYQHAPGGYTEIEIIGYRNQDLPMREFVEKIIEAPGVVSVECLDWSLNGMIVHTDYDL